MDTRVKIVRRPDGLFHAWLPFHPKGWLARAASCHEVCRKAQDAVISWFDIQLGLPKNVVWARLPDPQHARSDWTRDLLIVMGQGPQKVTFRVKPTHEARATCVVGDFTGWHQLPMPKAEDAGFELSLKLSPGVYGYQYVIDGMWVSDPSNDELMSSEPQFAEA